MLLRLKSRILHKFKSANKQCYCADTTTLRTDIVNAVDTISSQTLEIHFHT
jgi:hypothetical protein